MLQGLLSVDFLEPALKVTVVVFCLAPMWVGALIATGGL